MSSMEMPFNAKPRPILQFFLDIRPGGLRLEAERVAREVDDVVAIRRFRNMEPGSEILNGIYRNQGRTVFFFIDVSCCYHYGYRNVLF